MKKTIVVLPMSEAIKFQSDESWAAISIATDVGTNPTLSNKSRVGLLEMTFEDADFIRPNTPPEYIFDEIKAKKILDFVSEMWDKVDCFMIHCHAGMSRSPAVAAAIENIYYGNGADSRWFKEKTPNMRVYRTILNTHQSSLI